MKGQSSWNAHSASVRARAVAAYDTGDEVRSIAAAMGIGKSTIYRWLRGRMRRARRGYWNAHNPSTRSQAVAAFEAGQDVRSIARSMGIGRTTIYRWLKGRVRHDKASAGRLGADGRWGKRRRQAA